MCARLEMGATEGNGAGGVTGKVSESKGRPDIQHHGVYGLPCHWLGMWGQKSQLHCPCFQIVNLMVLVHGFG